MHDHRKAIGQITHLKCRNIAKPPRDGTRAAILDNLEAGEALRQIGLWPTAIGLTHPQISGEHRIWRHDKGRGIDPEFMGKRTLASKRQEGDCSDDFQRFHKVVPFPMSVMNLLRACAMSIAMEMSIASVTQANEIRPTIADVEVGAETVTITLRITLETLLAGIDLASVQDTNDAPEAAIYDNLRAMSADQLEAMLRADWPRIARGFLIAVEGAALTPEIASVTIPAPGDLELPRDSLLTITAALPAGDAGVSLGLAPGYGSFVPRQMGGGDDAYEGFLSGGEMTPPLPRTGILTESAGAVFLRYIAVGFEHILPLGLDHILFVLGLYFFATRMGPLLWQVSAFTLANTITLALAATGVVKIPASIVEPLIAASIVYVGVENIIGRRNLKGRTAFVFGLGLLHGLGFASVLGDYGIASGRFVQALIGFNIGVELGQLAVIAMAFAVTGWFIKRSWYRQVIAIPASLVIAAIGAYWVVERTLL